MNNNFFENIAMHIFNNLDTSINNLDTSINNLDTSINNLDTSINNLDSYDISLNNENITSQIITLPLIIEISSNFDEENTFNNDTSNNISILRNIYYNSFLSPSNNNRLVTSPPRSFIYNILNNQYNTIDDSFNINNIIDDEDSIIDDEDSIIDESYNTYSYNTYSSSNSLINYNYRYNRINNRFNRSLSLRDIIRYMYLNYNYDEIDNPFLDNFINSTFENDKKKFKKVISDYEIEKLKQQKFIKKNELNTNIQCPIFCYEFEENEEIIKLPCNHNYNSEAIIKWLSEESNTCPICRYEFDYKEINIDNKRQELDNSNNIYNNDNSNNTIQDNNYDNFLNPEEVLLQEILLYSYSNNNNNNNNTTNDISVNFTMV